MACSLAPQPRVVDQHFTAKTHDGQLVAVPRVVCAVELLRAAIVPCCRGLTNGAQGSTFGRARRPVEVGSC